jgi:hypothetical protein
MKNLQTTVSPAESGEAGIPEILSDPSNVPEARAFYSSRPAFLDGAGELPDGQDDIEMAAVSHKTTQQTNGRDEEVLHALRYIRLQEDRVPAGEVTGVIDGELALKGLKWLRKNIKDENIHRSAVHAKTALGKEYKAQDELEERQKAEDATENGKRIETEISPPRKSRRAREREEQERQRQAQTEEHQEARKRELETYAAWREKNPYSGKPEADPYKALGTTVSPKGEIVIFEKEGFTGRLTAYLQELAEEPHKLFDELSEGVVEQDFLRENDMPITLALTQYAAEKSLKTWDELSYADSQEMLAMIPKWLSVFAGFPDEYKDGVRFTGISLDNLEAKAKDGAARIHAHVNDFGLKIIFKSMVRMAEEHPEEFLDTVYEILQQAVDTEDELTRRTILLALSGTVSQSYLARMSIMDAAIAPGLDRTQKLKAMDINLLMENEKCVVSESTKKPRKMIPKKFARQHEARIMAAEYGIDMRKKGWLMRLGQAATPPLVQAVRAGELPDSLYLKIKSQKESLPEDA